MDSWRELILKNFMPGVSRITVVSDPDGLLTEESIAATLRERNFELLAFDDPVAFRNAFESRFRSHWDLGQGVDLIVEHQAHDCDVNRLPYDLLQAARRLSFSLGDIFTGLSYPVVAALDRADLDALCVPQLRHQHQRLGDKATKDFVLRHVFGIAADSVSKPDDLLRILLQRHYARRHIPQCIDGYLLERLQREPTFVDWPLAALLTDREAFYAFLQERWPVFLDDQYRETMPSVCEPPKVYALAHAGPPNLPFMHPDVRSYVGNLFLEGLLKPVPYEKADRLSDSWVRVGIRTVPQEDRLNRINGLFDGLSRLLPGAGAKHGDWRRFARTWAELNALIYEVPEDSKSHCSERLQAVQTTVDNAFTTWAFQRYAALVNLPPAPPVMVHHVPRFLARQMEENSGSKVAMLLIDGLAMCQWVAVRDMLVARDNSLRLREDAVFAWVPSITSVSRQATFAGMPPFFFADSIGTTYRESELWTKFWLDEGLSSNEVVYLKGLGDGDLEGVLDRLSHPKIRVAGLVVDIVDRIMHGMELGSSGMQSQVRQWASGPYLGTLVQHLLTRGFSVYVTSDHGNVEAVGCGRPSEGAIADIRGERIRLYPTEILRTAVKTRFPSAIEWGQVGLPRGYWPLLAPGRHAFVPEERRIVCHGGISVEELIVPFVKIERGETR